MGNINPNPCRSWNNPCKQAEPDEPQPIKKELVNQSQFEFLYCIGRGGFGKVWKVKYKKDKTMFALKEMEKARIMSRRSLNSVMAERQFLTQLRHPFIVNMQFAFQDSDNIYLVCDLMTGGDLRYHLGKRIKFDQEQSRFIIACMVVSLQYIHQNQIIHRDIKPENLVFSNKGYIKVTDFGIAKTYQRENSHETSGTPSYMAPEVIFKQNHSYESDYYALGVICHELMLNKRPYKGRTRKELKEQMLHKKVKLRRSQCPPGWDPEAVEFINQCLQRKPCRRLGYNGASEVMQHPWLKNFDWQKLISQELESPYIPEDGQDHFDEAHANHTKTLGASEQEDLYNKKLLLRRDSIQHLFNGYYYDWVAEKKEKEEKEQKQQEIMEKSTIGSSKAHVTRRDGTTNNISKNFHSSVSHNDVAHHNEERKINNTFSMPLIQKIMTSKESIKIGIIGSQQLKEIKYRPQGDNQIFQLSDDKHESHNSTPDIKKMERDDFNDIVGPEKKSKKFKPERMSQNTTKNNQGSVERYPFGNLDRMLEESKNEQGEKGIPQLREVSEPDNDRYHIYGDPENSQYYPENAEENPTDGQFALDQPSEEAGEEEQIREGDPSLVAEGIEAQQKLLQVREANTLAHGIQPQNIDVVAMSEGLVSGPTGDDISIRQQHDPLQGGQPVSHHTSHNEEEEKAPPMKALKLKTADDEAPQGDPPSEEEQQVLNPMHEAPPSSNVLKIDLSDTQKDITDSISKGIHDDTSNSKIKIQHNPYENIEETKQAEPEEPIIMNPPSLPPLDISELQNKPEEKDPVDQIKEVNREVNRKPTSELEKQISIVEPKCSLQDQPQSSTEKQPPGKEIDLEKMDEEGGGNPTGTVESLAAMCPPSPRNPMNVHNILNQNLDNDNGRHQSDQLGLPSRSSKSKGRESPVSSTSKVNQSIDRETQQKGSYLPSIDAMFNKRLTHDLDLEMISGAPLVKGAEDEEVVEIIPQKSQKSSKAKQSTKRQLSKVSSASLKIEEPNVSRLQFNKEVPPLQMEEADEASPIAKEQPLRQVSGDGKPSLMLNLDKVNSVPVADSGVSSVVSHKELLPGISKKNSKDEVEVGKKPSIFGQFFGGSAKNQKIGIKEPELK